MNTGWRQFLESLGARIQDNLDIELPSRNVKSGEEQHGRFMMDLSWLSVIEVEGADAPEFLNGQFTSDLTLLTQNSFQYSAWCNPKGRVIAIFIIYRKHDSYCILIPTGLKDLFLKRLQIYILRSKVLIHDRSEETTCMGLIGTDQLPALSSIPEESGAVLHLPEYTSLRIADTGPSRLLVTGHWQTMVKLWQSLESVYTGSHTGLWRFHDIKSGIPWLTDTTSELFLPQELDLEILNGLSYSKGCFPGQEVISRLHYRGTVKQRLLYTEVPAQVQIPGIGARLYSDEIQNSAGTIINVADSGEGSCGIQAVADIDKAGSDLHVAGASRLSLRFHTQ